MKRFSAIPTKAPAVVGLSAFAVLGALSAYYGGIDVGPGPRVMAGSGSAPTSTVYRQPVVGSMNTGATATWSPPGPQPSVAKALPGGN